MQKQKIVTIWKSWHILLLVILFVLNVPLSAEQQETKIDKESRAAEIKAELSALKERLALLESQRADSESTATKEGLAPKIKVSEIFIEEPNDGKIETSAALTRTPPRLVPSTLTTITKEDIRRSQARSMYELLEMYVPNLQMLFTSEHPKTLGLRGIISHRSDKFLVLVNGRPMNERTDVGAMTEVDLPMLTDIHHIDVLRGPGSSLYGPGTTSMTINIITENAKTFQGEEITVRGGIEEQFTTFEYKLGRRLKDNSGIFVYAGVSQYGGADPADSPTVLGTEAPFYLRGGKSPSYTWTPYQGNDKIKGWFKNLNETPFERLKMKMYAEYTKGGFNIWGRYTQGGQWIDFTRWSNTWLGERETSDEGLSYSQAAIQASYEHRPLPDLTVKYSGGYEWFANENENYERAFFWKSFAEDEIYGKILARWTPDANHSLAFGGEWARDMYGKRFADTPVCIQTFGKFQVWGQLNVPEFDIDRQALFGEYQWNINKKFTLFINSRFDWNSYTKMMFSPRGVLIYTPNKKNTFKFIASQSAQINTAGQLWVDNELFHKKSPIEKLYALELRYERQHNDNLWLGCSLFLHRFENALGENMDGDVGAGGTSSKIIGDIKTWGIELEASYHKDRLKVDVSHSYTKLLDMSGPKPGITWNQYSASQFGFGDDFAQWHNHTSKIRAEYELSDKLILNGALCVLWGNPGGQDWADYRDSIYPDWDYQSGFDEPFEPSAYLNLGIEYKWRKNTTFQVTGYNLMGLFDENLNKRRVGFDDQLPGHYRIQPVAFGASLTHKF